MSLNIQKTSFGTLYPTRKERPVDSKLSRAERTGVAAASMMGVGGALAILAKTAKWKAFSLNPKVIMNSKIKDTYLYQAKFEEPEILAMGAGSILGGLVGGVIIDDRSSNTSAEIKSKVGEAIIQMGNMTVPILTVGQAARWGDKLEKNIEARIITPNKIIRGLVKLPKLIAMATGLGIGMYAGNISANYLKKNLLDSPQERKMKLSDMFMHWDDLCLAASFYAGEPETVIVDGVATKMAPTLGQKITAGFSRLLPIAMMMAGYQVGCKGLEQTPKRRQPREQHAIAEEQIITNKTFDAKNSKESIKTI